MKKIIAVFLSVLVIAIVSVCLADIIKYVDNDGVIHFTNQADSVPEQYSGQLQLWKKESKKSAQSSSKSHPSQIAQPESKNSKKEYSSEKVVEMYVTDWCPYCKKLEDFLRQKNIKYKKYNIDKDSSANARYKRLGGRGVPFSKIGDTVVSGFNTRAIMEALNE